MYPPPLSGGSLIESSEPPIRFSVSWEIGINPTAVIQWFKLATTFIETAEEAGSLRTLSNLVPGCINARTWGTFVWRIIAEGAVESPDFVIIANYIKCRSYTFKT